MTDRSSTRNQILSLLKMEAPLTVSKLARRLEITEMAVRRHLNTLERDSLVRSELLRQSMGRPTNQYYLSKQSEDLFPKSYHAFTLDLLKDIEKNEGKKQIDRLFERRCQRMTEAYQESFQGKPLDEQVRTLAELQDQKGYMATWKRLDDQRYELVEHNCPIAEVAQCFQQACSCELSWFRKLLDADVERVECLAKGALKCTYRIEETEGAGS